MEEYSTNYTKSFARDPLACFEYYCGMDSLASLLPNVLRKRGLLEHAEASHVIFKANEWLHTTFPDYADSLKASKFQHGTLLIECADSIVAHECQQDLGKLLSYLQGLDQPKEVRDIRLVRAL